MNRVAKWMMRLYPAAWRARYGDEMDALLADSGADAKTVADLLTGGMRMRFSKGSFLKLALALSAVGMLLGLGVSYLKKPEYRSMAALLMTPASVSEPMVQKDLAIQLLTQIMSRTTLSAIISDPRLDLYTDERKSTPLEDVIEEMKSDMRISLATTGRHATLFIIQFSYTDKRKAQQTVFALINAFMYQNMEMQRGAQGRAQGEVLEVVNAATLPVQPVSPNRYQYAGFGCLLGFLLAGAGLAIRGGGHSSSTAMLATNE